MSDDAGRADDAVAGLREQIEEVGRRTEHRFDPGARAVAIAVAVLVLLLAAALPWVSSTLGWEVLVGEPIARKVAGIAPRVFICAAMLFGVFGSVIALMIRRYGMAWICSLGCDLSVLFGGLAVWSQQTSSSHQPGPGPGPGMIVALIAMFALAVLWSGIVWKRSPQPSGRDPREPSDPEV